MGKGYEENQARRQMLDSYGKDLARRAKSRCELSGQSGVPLRIYEVPPATLGPSYERCLMLSDDTISALAKPATLVPDDWRHLGELIWSDLPLQQVMTVRILDAIAPRAPWAAQIVEDAYLDDDLLVEARSVPL